MASGSLALGHPLFVEPVVSMELVALWLFNVSHIYGAMWLCGYVAMWLRDYVAMWLF